jgi:hypothetical protein
MKFNRIFKALADGIKEEAELFANDRVIIAPVADLPSGSELPSTAPIPENPAAYVDPPTIQCPRCKFGWEPTRDQIDALLPWGEEARPIPNEPSNEEYNRLVREMRDDGFV